MLTEWGEALDREHPLPEYPRPQLVRNSYLNLNGPWECAFTSGRNNIPTVFDMEITVPFPPESELSGIGRPLGPDECIWYRRELELPDGFNRGRVLLHFGAVDQTARLWINGEDAAAHTGGYLPFTVDITKLLREKNTILLRASDDTDGSWHTRGKQKSKPGKIWYTPQSGVWQTVWVESVPESYIEDLVITPRLDESAVDLLVVGSGECTARVCGTDYVFPAGQTVRLPVPEAHPWTPEDPYLYDLAVKLGDDIVMSYFAMRKFSVGADSAGVKRLMLNNRPYFHNGLLDQGYWPDGLYAAPSDEAMVFDIQTAKSMGFNMLRKHVKVEPLRWYYHCDRLGMLVWQDMPNGGGKYSAAVVSAPLLTGMQIKDDKYAMFARREEKGRREFTNELREMITHLYNCPCIAVWVPFNEGWGQFDAEKNVAEILKLDDTRTIDHASGWHDQGIGELKSLHVYFDEYTYAPDKLGRAVVLSEFGGYTCAVEGHMYSPKPFGYKKFADAAALRAGMVLLYDGQVRPAARSGLAAAVYTQLTDVENEMNGLITYDRRVVKIAPDSVERVIRIPALRD